jgi:hypothetical protein
MNDDLTIPDYEAHCAAKGYAPADLPRSLHRHALPPATRDRQLARQAVTRAIEAVEQAEHEERLAVLGTARARQALAHWRERLADAEKGETI